MSEQPHDQPAENPPAVVNPDLFAPRPLGRDADPVVAVGLDPVTLADRLQRAARSGEAGRGATTMIMRGLGIAGPETLFLEKGEM